MLLVDLNGVQLTLRNDNLHGSVLTDLHASILLILLYHWQFT